MSHSSLSLEERRLAEGAFASGSDCVIVGGSLPAGYQHPRTDDGCIINEFGMKLRQGPLYMETVAAPLALLACQLNRNGQYAAVVFEESGRIVDA